MEKEDPFIKSEKPLQDVIAKFSFYPNTKEFESEKHEIEEKYNFKLLFPNYFDFVINLETKYVSFQSNKKPEGNFHDLFKKYVRESFCPIELKDINLKSKYISENQIIPFLGNWWINQREYTKAHLTIFFHLTESFIRNHQLFSEYDKNLLYWTILFHDIGKNHKIIPNVIEEYEKDSYPYDKFHPFKSIIIFIDIFLNNNYFYFETEEERVSFISNFVIFKDVIFKSYSTFKSKESQLTSYNLSFDHIEDIYNFIITIKKHKENKWIYDISVLIIFHQSLPNHTKHMNDPLLSDEYIKKFFSLRLIEMMRVIMVYDSSSHSLSKGGDWVEEINNQVDKLRELFLSE